MDNPRISVDNPWISMDLHGSSTDGGEGGKGGEGVEGGGGRGGEGIADSSMTGKTSHDNLAELRGQSKIIFSRIPAYYFDICLH